MEIEFFNHSDRQQSLYSADGTCVFLPPMAKTKVSPAYVSQMPNPTVLECLSHSKEDLIKAGVIKNAPPPPLAPPVTAPQSAPKNPETKPEKATSNKDNEK